MSPLTKWAFSTKKRKSWEINNCIHLVLRAVAVQSKEKDGIAFKKERCVEAYTDEYVWSQWVSKLAFI